MLIIVFSTDSLSRGGKERQIMVLASYLVKNKNKLFILAKRRETGDNYFKEYQVNDNQIRIYRRFRDYKKTLNKIKPDLVVSWDAGSSLYNLLLFRRSGFVFINGSIRHGIRRLRISHYFRSLICQLSPYLMANSEAGLKANILQRGNQRFVLYNGIESKFINNQKRSEIETLRNEMIPGYFENPGFVYITVANFVPYKDYYTVLKALSQLKEMFLFYYLILGDGPLRSEIEMSIKDYNLEDRVFLVGKTENVRDYLFASDIMIHSSRGEGISNAILEGMYAGLPVIATNVGGIPETVFSKSSMLFSYRDHEALYLCLLKSQELKTSFNPESEEYKDHLNKFSVDTMVNKFEEIIQNVLSDKKN